MRWKSRTHKEKLEARTEWHKWFAWYPVRDEEGYNYWLTTIYRRGFYFNDVGDSFWIWQFKKDLLEILKDPGHDPLLPGKQ